MNRECSIQSNKLKCICTYEPCSRKGLRCECLTYHWEQGELPSCLFPSQVEHTYDRWLSRFIRCYQ